LLRFNENPEVHDRQPMRTVAGRAELRSDLEGHVARRL
jgi:hypothetical protein